MRVLARKIARSELKDPSGLDPVVKELMKKLRKAIQATRSRSLNTLLTYMNVNHFEKELLLMNFDVMLDALEKELKKHQTDYFGWALLFANWHYKHDKMLYWGIVEPLPKKPDMRTMKVPPVDKEIEKMYLDRTDALMSGLRDDLRSGIKQDIDIAVLNGWEDKKLQKHLDERFRKAENRAVSIARTEMQFAYNAYIISEARKDGFTKLRWITQIDEFVCKDCGPNHGKVFDIDSLPQIPAHPNCRCIWQIVMESK